MFSFSAKILIAIALLGSIAHAQDGETYQSEKVWQAIPAGGLIGFGLGHRIQQRSNLSQIVFVTFDGFSVPAWAISHFIDCGGLSDRQKADDCYADKRRRIKNLETAMLVSRLVQAIDLSIWGVKYYNRFHPVAYVLPTNDGAKLTLALEF